MCGMYNIFGYHKVISWKLLQKYGCQAMDYSDHSCYVMTANTKCCEKVNYFISIPDVVVHNTECFDIYASQQ